MFLTDVLMLHFKDSSNVPLPLNSSLVLDKII